MDRLVATLDKDYPEDPGSIFVILIQLNASVGNWNLAYSHKAVDLPKESLSRVRNLRIRVK